MPPALPPSLLRTSAVTRVPSTERPEGPVFRALCAAFVAAFLWNGSSLAQTLDANLWVTNGQVNAVARDGNTLYLGGAFTHIGPPTGGAALIDATSGALIGGFPQVRGTVHDAVPDGSGGWFVGGFFTHVGGVARQNLAHIDLNNQLTAWNPSPDAAVQALILNGGILYAGGGFSNVGGQARRGIAALDASTGLATSWYPGDINNVFSLALSGTTLYVGGNFCCVGANVRSDIAAVDITTGSVTSWNPNADGSVFALAVSGSTVYAGGQFASIGGASRFRLAALDASTGAATSWDPNPNSIVECLAVSGSTIYVGGAFTSIGGQTRNRIAALSAASGSATSWNANASNRVFSLLVNGALIYAGGDFTTIGGQARNRIAALDNDTGAATSWNPAANGPVNALAVNASKVFAGGSGLGGLTRNNLAALDLTTGAATGWDPNANLAVSAMALKGATLYVGGSFTNISGVARNRVAALNTATATAQSWNPNASSTVEALAVEGGTVYAGGLFTSIGGASRSSIAALDASGLATSWNPSANARVRALAMGPGVVYAGGDFTSIGGQARNRVAALSASTGSATSFDPNANLGIRALAVHGDKVYLGGDFTTVGGQSRGRIALVEKALGSMLAWNPNASSSVRSLAVEGATVYVGGQFSTIGGQTRSQIAALDSATALARAWNPSAGGTVAALAVDALTVFAGGAFTVMGGVPAGNVSRITSPPVVTGRTPTSGGNAGSVTLTVHGSGLAAGSTLRLERSGEPNIVATGVVVAADGNSLNGSLNLAGAKVGLWDVVVITPDLQTGTLANGFTVEEVRAAQLRVSVMGPTLQSGSFVVRRDRRTAYDVVIENPGNVDALYVPLWLAGIPTDATVELDFALSHPAQGGGEPNWSTVPLFFTSAGGKYVPLVIPRVPPGRTSRRVFITVPGPAHPPFTLTASVTAPWVDGNQFRNCIAAGGISNPSCMGAQLDATNALIASNPQMVAMSGIALWAKVAWQCEGAGSLPAALLEAEQVLDYLVGPVEGGAVGAGCEGVLGTWWREVMAVSVVGAVDPNDKLGAQGTLTGTQALPYTVRFENLPAATAPAQQVVVTDQLDPSKMEMSTVSLDAIRFGNVQIHPPPGLKSYSTRVDLRPATNLLVDVAASLDPFTHVLSWYFTSIDPVTGLAPSNPAVGFLPPNTLPPQGEGSVLFTVMPKSNLANGTIISNAGSILFDDPPTTNTPTWTNGVDNAPPASHVLPLAGSSHQPSITVSWTADGSPPDLRDFTVYVKQDAGPYRVWRQNTTATSDTLVPPLDRQFHTFSFYSVSRDQIGNIEAAPSGSDATTMSTTAVGEPGEGPALELRGAWPNPVVGALRVGLTLTGREPATLELLDIAGRRVMRRDVGSLGPGAHVVNLEPATPLRPGLYFIRLTRGAEELRARVAVIQ